MPVKGTLTQWKDDQGFGFAKTDQASDKVFVHIKQFSYKSRRPVEGDRLVYDIEKDTQDRLQAVNIQLLHDFERQRIRNERHKKTEDGKQFWSKFAAYPFILLLAVLYFYEKIELWVLGYFLLINLVTFYKYWSDKQAAQNNQRRVPENTLHQLSLMGGWIGAIVAQLYLRHKSQKAEFRQMFWMTVIANILIFIALTIFLTFPNTF
jgi:uncharacterized membrane protein YsdA (DUF1294 family)/cold shock CspA family protein